MRRSLRPSLVLVAAMALAAGLVVVAPTAVAEPGPDLAEACAPLTDVPELGSRVCKSIETGLWLGAQTCRRVPGTEDVCTGIDGRIAGPAAMDEYERSWQARALDLQRELDRDVPLLEALLPHSHNSANSAAYPPSVSTLDANQVVSVTDQLRLGIRAIELDVHWHLGEAVQCHGEPVATPAGTVHVGCSVDRTLEENLLELRAWLDDPANAGELVLLYLENVLDDDPAAHARAVEVISSVLGPLVFRPEGAAGCQPLPVATESKGSILGTGARVLLTGNCGPAGWTDWVFERGPAWDESGSSTGYTCDADRSSVDYGSTLVRRYEDSTWLSAMAGAGSHITAEVLADMVRCGVNLPGLDQVHPGDERLRSLVWSWAVDQPATEVRGACAVQGSGGRWTAEQCTGRRAVACRTPSGWTVSRPAPRVAAGPACAAAGGSFGVPHNGWDNAQLRLAAEAAGADSVWLAHRQDASGRWVRG